MTTAAAQLQEAICRHSSLPLRDASQAKTVKNKIADHLSYLLDMHESWQDQAFVPLLQCMAQTFDYLEDVAKALELAVYGAKATFLLPALPSSLDTVEDVQKLLRLANAAAYLFAGIDAYTEAEQKKGADERHYDYAMLGRLCRKFRQDFAAINSSSPTRKGVPLAVLIPNNDLRPLEFYGGFLGDTPAKPDPPAPMFNLFCSIIEKLSRRLPASNVGRRSETASKIRDLAAAFASASPALLSTTANYVDRRAATLEQLASYLATAAPRR